MEVDGEAWFRVPDSNGSRGRLFSVADSGAAGADGGGGARDWIRRRESWSSSEEDEFAFRIMWMAAGLW